jgi:hypothetical protein
VWDEFSTILGPLGEIKVRASQFASIKPHTPQDMKMPAGRNKLSIPLPDELAKRNVLVEVSAAGKTRSQASFASATDMKVTENFGALRVTDAVNGKALSKVYARPAGSGARLPDRTAWGKGGPRRAL